MIYFDKVIIAEGSISQYAELQVTVKPLHTNLTKVGKWSKMCLKCNNTIKYLGIKHHQRFSTQVLMTHLILQVSDVDVVS
jgi:hypothetical protein